MYPDSKHSNPLKIGEAYQDKVAEVIKKRYGYKIHYYKTKKEQYELGESVEGFEIKYDGWISKSKRMSIEIAERTRKDLQDFTESGIFRKDNTKWYCQGDDKTLWIFSKKKLQEYYRNRCPMVIDDRPPTIKKFYISLETADKLAVRKIEL